MAQPYKITYIGAAIAVGIAMFVLMGHVFGIREWTTMGNRVPMGGVSMVFLCTLSYIAYRSADKLSFAWWAFPVALLAWLGIMMRVTGIGLWQIHPLVNIASFPAMTCYTLIAWGIVFRNPPVARAVPLAFAVAIAGISAAAHWPHLFERTMLATQFMSLPSAIAIMALAGGMLVDMGTKPFRGWREMFPT